MMGKLPSNVGWVVRREDTSMDDDLEFDPDIEDFEIVTEYLGPYYSVEEAAVS